MSRVEWVPDKYQELGVEHLVTNAVAGLLADPGLGKTAMTLMALAILKKMKLLEGALILAPRRPAIMVWPQELEKWDFCSGLSYEVLTATNKSKAIHRKADVYITNYENIAWLTQNGNNSYLRALIRAKRLNVLVYDELTKMKDRDSGRARALAPWLKFFARRYGLTGSFGASGLEAIFGQMLALDQGASLGPFITHFRAKYMMPVPGNRLWVPKPLAEKQVLKKLAPMMLRLDAEHLDLPKLIVRDIKFDLPAPVQKMYQTLLRDKEITLRNGRTVVAVNAGVLSSILRQVVTGFIYMQPMFEAEDEGSYDYDPGGAEKEYYPLHTERYDAALDHLEELKGHHCLVGFIFIQELRDMFKFFKQEYPVIGGGGRVVKDRALVTLQDEWNAGRHPVMFGNPASVAHGLNLQGSGAEHILFTSTPWGYERYDQFIRRLKRRGSTAKKVVVTRLIARGTIDEHVVSKLAKGENSQNSVHDYFKMHGVSGFKTGLSKKYASWRK